MSPRCVVIAVGNPYRHDDAVAPAVLEHLRTQCLPDDVELTESDGDAAELIERWDGASLAIVVDAVHAHPPSPGKVHRFETAGLGLPGTQASSHGLGLGEAVDLGAALGRLPQRLVIYAVEGSDFDFGIGLTPPVADAVPRVVDRIRQELNEAPESLEQKGRR